MGCIMRKTFFRRPILLENTDALQIRESENCSIADGIREATEVIEYYF